MTDEQAAAAELAKAYAGVVALARVRSAQGDLVGGTVRAFFTDPYARPDHAMTIDWLGSVASERRLFRPTAEARAATTLIGVINRMSSYLGPDAAREVWQISIELGRQAAAQARHPAGGDHRSVVRSPDDLMRVLLD